MIQAKELTVPAVMNALKAGHFYGTTGPLIHQIESRNNQEIIVHCSPAESVIFYSDSPWSPGRSVIKHDMTDCNYFVQKNEHFIRVEVRDSTGRKAWSAPIKV